MSEASETEWTIPPSWAWSRMGEIATVVGGGTPRTDDPSNYEGGEIAWITPADLSGYTHKYIQRGARNITQRGLENSGARTMPAGTVLFSSRAPIGYVAIAANPVSTNQGFKSFVLPEDLSPDYIYYYLQRAKEIARGLASGTTFLEISGAKATIIPVPVAPRPEQDRIVAEIEKQFTRLDDAVTALKRVQANLKRYRASVLKAACEGRLVPTEAELTRKEARSYEPASELLKRILAERRAKWEADQLQKMIAAGKPPKNDDWKKSYKEPVKPTLSHLPHLPEGWTWTTFDQLITFGPQNGIYKPSTAYGRGTKIVRIDDYQDDSFKAPDELRQLILAETEARLYALEAGDMLINRVNSPSHLGKCCVITPGIAGSVFESNMMRLRLASGVQKGFLVAYLRSLDGKKRLTSNAKWAVNQASINQQDVANTPVPLPPLEEQSHISAELDRRITNIDHIKSHLTSKLAAASQLRSAVLKNTFSGKLVPQDPNDEPASVLLERIRAARAALAANNGNQKATPEADINNGQRRRRVTRLAHRVSGGKGVEK
ncbi:MAG TPA: restriction endonuclease subunit S [Candidatus Angelobacter sp.]|nr:restriction endonuclease subunit S [Candidatus Angelobacter sp.]